MTRKKTFMAVASLVLIVTMIFTTGPFATVISHALSQGQTSKYTWYNVKDSWMAMFTFTDRNGNTRTVAPKGGMRMSLMFLGDGTPVYCVEMDKSLSGGTVDASTSNIYSTPEWRAISDVGQTGIKRALIYGYPNNTGNYGISGITNYEKQYAVQLLVWEFQTNKRTDYVARNSNGNTTTSSSSVASPIFGGLIEASGVEGDISVNYTRVKQYYFALLDAMSKHQNKPSLNKTTLTLKPGQSETLTDANSLLQNFNVSTSDSTVATATVLSSNQLKITGGSKAGTATIYLTKKLTETSGALALTGAGQMLIYGAVSDPVKTQLNITVPTGSCQLTKTSDDGAKAGFKFTLTKSDGSYTKDGTTDANGKITWTGLQPGTYTVTEKLTSAQSGKYQTLASKTVTVTAGSTATVSFANKVKLGAVAIYKSDDAGNEIEGVKFGVYASSSNASSDTSRLATLTTDADGEAIYGGSWNSVSSFTLTAGTTYYFKELSAPAGYTISSGIFSAKVVAGKITYAKDSNNQDPVNNRQGKISLEKVDSDGKKLGAGYVFGVYSDSACKNQVTTLTTGSNGTATSGWLNAGTYYVKEKALPAGDTTHSLSTRVIPVTIPFGQTIKIVYSNAYAYGGLGVLKANTSGSRLSGAVFGIFTSKANANIGGSAAIGTMTTNSNGVATYGVTSNGYSLVKGTYYVRELKAPAGYEADSTIYTVTVTEGALTYANSGNPIVNKGFGNIAIKKVTQLGYALPGAVFGVYTKSDCLASSYVGSCTTGEDGVAIFGENTSPENPYAPYELREGMNYWMKEIHAPQGYKMNPNAFKVTVVRGKTTYANGGEPVVNEYTLGGISVRKVDTSGNPLAGVKFGFYSDRDCTNLVYEGTTNSSGWIYYGGRGTSADPYTLEAGTVFYIKETQTLANYVLDTTVTKVTVEANTTVTFKFINASTVGVLEIHKYNDDSDETSGFQFRVTGRSADGDNIDLTVTTGDKATYTVTSGCSTKTYEYEYSIARFASLPPGTYTVSEILTQDQASVYVQLGIQTVTITADQTTTLDVHNVMYKGAVGIRKVDEQGHPLAGVVFELREYTSGCSNKLIGTVTTDANGEAVFGGRGTANDPFTLDYSAKGYYFIEKETVAGYHLSRDKIDVGYERNKITWANGGNGVINYPNGGIKLMKVNDYGEPIQGVTFALMCASDSELELEVKSLSGDFYRELFIQSVRTDAAYGMLAAMESGMTKEAIDDMNSDERDAYVAAHTNYEDFDSYFDSLTEAKYNAYAASVGLRDFNGYKDNWYRTEIVQPYLSAPAEDWNNIVGRRLEIAGYDLETLDTDAKFNAAVKAVTGYQTAAAFIAALKAELTRSGNLGYEDIPHGYALALNGFLTYDEFREYLINKDFTVLTTDANGEIRYGGSGTASDPYTLDPFNQVMIIERNTPSGYIPQSEYMYTSVSSGETVTYKITNESIKGKAKVLKTSANGAKEGFEFRLTGTSTCGIRIDITKKTDANGIADFGEVPVGTYTVTETPMTGYVIQGPKTITVTENKTAEVSFYNELACGGIGVYKTDDAGSPVKGAVFEFFKDKNCTDSVGTAQTGSDGRAVFGGSGTTASPFTLVEGTTYYVKEKTAPAGLVADTGVYSVTIVKNKITYVSGGDPVVNVRKGGIAVRKTDDIGNPVAGVVFGVYRDEACQTEIAQATTDSSGNAYYGGTGSNNDPFLLLPDTVWYFKEKTAPAGYVLNPAAFDVTVASGTISWANGGSGVVNTRMGAVGVYKTDNDGNPLSGVRFGVFSDPECASKLSEIVTGETGYAYYGGTAMPFSLVPGTTVYFRELETLSGYILDEGIYSATVIAGEIILANGGDAIVNHHKGSVRIIKTSEDGNVEGFKFTLTGNGETKSGTTNAQGEIIIENLMPGTYTVTENLTEEQAHRYTCSPEEQQVVVVADNTAVVTFVNTLNTSGLKIVKASEDGNLKGFTFRITGTTTTGAQVNMTGVTNEFGVIQFEDLKPGDYVISEELSESQSAVYYCTNDSRELQIRDGESYVLNFVNELKKGSVKVKKASEDGILQGLTFRLTGTSLSGMEIERTAVTDQNGIAIFEDIPVSGSDLYVISEINAPSRYVAVSSQNVTVTYQKQSEASFTNTLVRGSITLTKFDADYPENKLTGAEFTLYKDLNSNGAHDEDEPVYGTLSETETGVYTLAEIPYGRYVLIETRAPKYFEPDLNQYAVFVSEPGTLTVENTPGKGFLDNAQKGSLRITKRSEDGQIESIRFRVTGTDLTGHAYDQTFSTNASGVIEVTGLRPGSYTVSEIEGENKKYVLPADQEIVIKPDLQTEIEFENTLVRSNITGVKKSEDGDLLSGVVFGLYKDNELIMTAETADGEFRFENIPYGDYVVREETPLEGFVLDSTEYPVSVRENGKTIRIDVAANRYERGSVIGYKKDASDNLLAGALFGLFPETETEFDENHAILTAVSGDDGVFRFENVRYGRYVIRELGAPEGFVITDSPFSAVIDSDGCEVEITVTNMPVTGNVRTTKIDEEYPENRLTGAVFEIWEDTNGNKAYDPDLDLPVGEMTESAIGTYMYENLVYGGYFLHEKVAPDGFIPDEAYYYFSITQNSETVDVGNNADGCFLNSPKLTELVIRKTSSDGKLDGFSFRVQGVTAGGITYDETFVTDEHGEIRVTGLRHGEYVVSEVVNEVSAAYRHPEDQSIVLGSDGAYTLEFYNYKNIPIDTGVSLTTMPYVILFSICGAGFAVAVVLMILKKKKKEGHEDE